MTEGMPCGIGFVGFDHPTIHTLCLVAIGSLIDTDISPRSHRVDEPPYCLPRLGRPFIDPRRPTYHNKGARPPNPPALAGGVLSTRWGSKSNA